jgi:hypothetical protein
MSANPIRYYQSTDVEIAENIRLNASQKQKDNRAAQPKQQEHGTLPRESEKEKIKRQLYNLIDRVDKL